MYERMLAFAIAEKEKILEKQETAAREWFTERGLGLYIGEGSEGSS